MSDQSRVNIRLVCPERTSCDREDREDEEDHDDNASRSTCTEDAEIAAIEEKEWQALLSLLNSHEMLCKALIEKIIED